MYKILFKDKEYRGSVILHVKGKISARTTDGVLIDVYDITEEEYKQVSKDKDNIRLSDDYKDILVGNKKIKLNSPKNIEPADISSNEVDSV